jgi:hypothetical protein
VHLPTPGLFTTDPGITRRTPVNMARCSIEACFGFDGLADKASSPTGRLRTNNPKLPGPAPPPPLFARFARWVERQVGRSSTFVLAIAVVLAWAVSGPIFGWSDT